MLGPVYIRFSESWKNVVTDFTCIAVTLKLRTPNKVRTNIRRPERTRKRAVVVKNIDTARIACGRFYVTVRCPSVCLYGLAIVNCSSVRRVCCCGPGGQEVSIDCCTAGARQQRRRSSTALSSKCEQCHVSSRRRTLNTFSRMGATSKNVYILFPLTPEAEAPRISVQAYAPCVNVHKESGDCGDEKDSRKNCWTGRNWRRVECSRGKSRASPRIREISRPRRRITLGTVRCYRIERIDDIGYCMITQTDSQYVWLP